jgi:hypothetical protein
MFPFRPVEVPARPGDADMTTTGGGPPQQRQERVSDTPQRRRLGQRQAGGDLATPGTALPTLLTRTSGPPPASTVFVSGGCPLSNRPVRRHREKCPRGGSDAAEGQLSAASGHPSPSLRAASGEMPLTAGLVTPPAHPESSNLSRSIRRTGGRACMSRPPRRQPAETQIYEGTNQIQRVVADLLFSSSICTFSPLVGACRFR